MSEQSHESLDGCSLDQLETLSDLTPRKCHIDSLWVKELPSLESSVLGFQPFSSLLRTQHFLSIGVVA